MQKDNWDIAGELAARKYPIPKPGSMEVGALGFLFTFAVLVVLILLGAIDPGRSKWAVGVTWLLGFAVPYIVIYRQEARHARERQRIYERLEAKNAPRP